MQDNSLLLEDYSSNYAPGVEKKSDNFTFRLPDDLRQRLKVRAQSVERSEGWLARHYIETGLAADAQSHAELREKPVAYKVRRRK